MPSDAQLYELHKGRGLTYAEIARALNLSADSVRGRVSRHRSRHVLPTLLSHDLGKPWILEPGQWWITGDYQLPTTSAHWVDLLMNTAQRLTRRPRLIIAGDFINADAFSDYPSDVPLPTFQHEIMAAREVMAALLDTFVEVYWFTGNHERRVGKKTNGAINSRMLADMLTTNPRLRVSHWGHCIIRNPGGNDWRVTHGSNYSVNQLTMADMLAQKYQTNIISHHEHHLALGWDRFKRYVLVNNGGLFAMNSMSYAVLDDSKSPNMCPGFTLLDNGYPYVFGPEPFTRWRDWLSAEALGEIAA